MESGTLGLSGAADATLILDRDSQGAKLYSRGRDVEEIESAVVFDKLTCQWRVLGDATEVRRSDRLLGKVVKAGEVEKVLRGRYIHPDRTTSGIATLFPVQRVRK